MVEQLKKWSVGQYTGHGPVRAPGAAHRGPRVCARLLACSSEVLGRRRTVLALRFAINHSGCSAAPPRKWSVGPKPVRESIIGPVRLGHTAGSAARVFQTGLLPAGSGWRGHCSTSAEISRAKILLDTALCIVNVRYTTKKRVAA